MTVKNNEDRNTEKISMDIRTYTISLIMASTCQKKPKAKIEFVGQKKKGCLCSVWNVSTQTTLRKCSTFSNVSHLSLSHYILQKKNTLALFAYPHTHTHIMDRIT